MNLVRAFCLRAANLSSYTIASFLTIYGKKNILRASSIVWLKTIERFWLYGGWKNKKIMSSI